MQTRDRGVKKEKRNDQRRGRDAREPTEPRQNPKQLRDDPDMQTGDREKMKRARLLKRLLDVVARLVTQPERHAADQRADRRANLPVRG